MDAIISGFNQPGGQAEAAGVRCAGIAKGLRKAEQPSSPPPGIQRGQPQQSTSRAMEILQQLGELFLEALPTVIIVFLFYLFLRANFFKPMDRIYAERSARIEGARAEAAAAQTAAQEKLDGYNAALQKARGELYAEQEKERQKVLGERMKLIREKRSEAQARGQQAKERIAAELAAARAELERQTPELAGEIVRSILERGSGPRAGARR